MRTVARADDGVAAVEFAIVATLFMLLAFGALPLYSMARGYQRVVGASSSVVRFTTSVDANGTNSGSCYTRRPSAGDIAAFADDPTLTVTAEFSQDSVTWLAWPADPCAAPRVTTGDDVRVSASTDVDLGVLGPIANAVGSLSGAGSIAPEGVLTMTSTATGREE